MDTTLLELIKDLEARAVDYALYGGSTNEQMLKDAEKRLLHFIEDHYD